MTSGSGSGSAATPAPPPASPPATPAVFFGRGTPTFIVGTAGDDRSDRAIAGQADLVRSVLFPSARRIADTEVDLASWPTNPVIYGGAHVNALIAKLAPVLPVSISAGTLTLGEHVFTSDELALITVIPERTGAGGYPELLLFAGTGTPGVEEINSGSLRADAPIVIADAFGPLVTGTWTRDATGTLRAQLGERKRRVNWRETAKDVAGVAVKLRFWDGSAAANDAAAIEQAARGIATVMKKLSPGGAPAMTVYVHPDKRSKATLTGNGGDGHAIPLARTLHVYNVTGLEALVAHEATHVILPQTWGSPGSALFGEGVAVWVSGQYGGTPFASFKTLAKPSGPIRELLGAGFRKLPEAVGYSLGAIVVDIAIKQVGLANVRDHLYGATAETWDDACKRAGTTAAALDAALTAALQ